MPLAAAAAAPAPATAEGAKQRTLEVSAAVAAYVITAVVAVDSTLCCTHTADTQSTTHTLHLQEMRFDNTFVRELPGDKETANTLRQVMKTDRQTERLNAAAAAAVTV